MAKAEPLVRRKLLPASGVTVVWPAIALVAATLWNGVPAVRHDWSWPVERNAFIESVVNITSGWDVSGLGRPATHTAQYLASIPLLLVGLAGGSAAALGAYAAVIGGVIGYAAMRIAKRNGLSLASATILAAFLLFNPWVYDKLVAGHLAMILSYACTIVVWAELSAPEPAARATTLAMIGASFQPQFFFFGFVGCIVRARSAACRTAAMFGTLAILPYLTGVASHLRFVSATPVTLTWEHVQSVRPLEALLLRGYFAGYDVPFAGYAGTLGVLAFAVFALVAVSTQRRPALWASAAFAVLTAVLATGTRGPLAPLIAPAFENVPAFGLYRELFDLIGLVAGGYAVLAGAALARFRALVPIGAVAAALLAAVWLRAPPSRLWLNAAGLPVADRGDQPGRYAVFPPYQPVDYDGRGSGLDPATTSPSLQITPLNTYLFEFPETTALETYWNGGSSRDLARLGTNRLVCRPGFAAALDAASVLGDPARRRGLARCEARSSSVPDAAPLFAIQRGSHLCSLCRNVGDGNVFFGDVRPGVPRVAGIPTDESTYYSLLPHPRAGVDPAHAWVDARLVFAERPDIAQTFGGVFTTSDDLLPVDPRAQIMLDVRGVLRDERGRVVAADTRGYRWVALPHDSTAVRCAGSCAIALAGRPPRTAPLEGGAVPYRAAPWRWVAPWLCVVDLPPGGPQLVRSLTSYDDYWLGFAGGHLAAHLRLDGILNGWYVSGHGMVERLVVVHGLSAFQLLLELVGTIAVVRAFFIAAGK